MEELMSKLFNLTKISQVSYGISGLFPIIPSPNTSVKTIANLTNSKK